MSMKLMPSSTARRNTRLASSWSDGGPQTPSPVMRIEPKPMRLTVRSPPMSIVPAASVVGVAVMSNLPQDQGPTHRRTCRSWSASRIFSVGPFQRHQLACDLHRTSCGRRLLCPIWFARSGLPDLVCPIWIPLEPVRPPVLVARPSGSRERPLGVAERLPSPITDAIRGGQPRPAEAAVDGRDGGGDAYGAVGAVGRPPHGVPVAPRIVAVDCQRAC